MLHHFTFKPMFENSQLPGWIFSFYYKQQPYHGEYHQDGTIEWKGSVPADEEVVKKMIHELMIYHVYD